MVHPCVRATALFRPPRFRFGHEPASHSLCPSEPCYAPRVKAQRPLWRSFAHSTPSVFYLRCSLTYNPRTFCNYKHRLEHNFHTKLTLTLSDRIDTPQQHKLSQCPTPVFFVPRRPRNGVSRKRSDLRPCNSAFTGQRRPTPATVSRSPSTTSRAWALCVHLNPSRLLYFRGKA